MLKKLRRNIRAISNSKFLLIAILGFLFGPAYSLILKPQINPSTEFPALIIDEAMVWLGTVTFVTIIVWNIRKQRKRSQEQ